MMERTGLLDPDNESKVDQSLDFIKKKKNQWNEFWTDPGGDKSHVTHTCSILTTFPWRSNPAPQKRWRRSHWCLNHLLCWGFRSTASKYSRMCFTIQRARTASALCWKGAEDPRAFRPRQAAVCFPLQIPSRIASGVERPVKLTPPWTNDITPAVVRRGRTSAAADNIIWWQIWQDKVPPTHFLMLYRLK